MQSAKESGSTLLFLLRQFGVRLSSYRVQDLFLLGETDESEAVKVVVNAKNRDQVLYYIVKENKFSGKSVFIINPEAGVGIRVPLRGEEQ